jgi:hypothetical protein
MMKRTMKRMRTMRMMRMTGTVWTGEMMTI